MKWGKRRKTKGFMVVQIKNLFFLSDHLSNIWPSVTLRYFFTFLSSTFQNKHQLIRRNGHTKVLPFFLVTCVEKSNTEKWVVLEFLNTNFFYDLNVFLGSQTSASMVVKTFINAFILNISYIYWPDFLAIIGYQASIFFCIFNSFFCPKWVNISCSQKYRK